MDNISFGNRVKSMLKLDFYRLFHTPAFYIMILIAGIIPAMVLGMPPSEVETQAPVMIYTNTWQVVESVGNTSTTGMDLSGYANINMVFIFAGLLMAIFVSHDYSSGFVKNIFTVHSKKVDYVLSKSAIGIFGGCSMIVTYVLGAVLAGGLSGKAFDVNVFGLLMCLISKMFLMGLFCSIFLAISVFFKSKFWIILVFIFIFGMMFYPLGSIATLDSNIITVIITVILGIVGVAIFGGVSTFILKKRDLI